MLSNLDRWGYPAPGKTLEFARLTGAMSEGISQNRSFLRLLEYEHHLNDRRVQEAANQTFPISASGFTIGATITSSTPNGKLNSFLLTEKAWIDMREGERICVQ
jgi:hypothetical protein